MKLIATLSIWRISAINAGILPTISWFLTNNMRLSDGAVVDKKKIT
ncbi:hypothetical protein CFter6_3246 [Collimonas fungivorans]|uniref:Uncharacterized protein n=1 Tax=Collimonas fungivorans TaxID=158899 RepID=A0A127PDJ6_9BURK|nr:hypothetical protein CFter6_3246 [Collimonas fungivorans]